MICAANLSDGPTRRYNLWTLGSMALYVVLNLAALAGLLAGLPALGQWGLAVLAAAPIGVHIWATLVFMRDSDEFTRAVMGKRFAVAAGVAMMLFSAWGFAESYAGAPHAPGWMIYGLFWLAYGVVTPLITTSR